MTLRLKFSLLIALLGAAVFGSTGAAWWSVALLNRELSTPFRSVASVLEGLGYVKRTCEAKISLLGAPVAPEAGAGREALEFTTTRHAMGELAPVRGVSDAERASFVVLRSIASTRLDQLEADEWYRTRVGVSTWRNLRDRVARADALAAVWLGDDAADDARQEARASAIDGFARIHELIEKSELQILADANAAVGFGDRLQRNLVLWLVAVLLSALLVGVLAFVLLRRWIDTPVAALREAAGRIASGDFEHRIPARGADELASLSREVNHMAAMVSRLQHERIDQERVAAMGQLVRRLVHNIRNPLSGIRGLAEVTRMELPSGSDDRENMDTIISTVDHFDAWLSELLDMTSPADVHPEPIVPSELAAQVVDTHAAQAKAAGIALTLDADNAPARAMADPRQLSHAVSAVLGNAIEVSPTGGAVRVEVGGLGEDRWVVRVSDTGPGVPKELMHRIFEPHFTTKPRGTGTGLAVAIQVVRAHGGRIDVQNRLGPDQTPAGAVFALELPFDPRGGSPESG